MCENCKNDDAIYELLKSGKTTEEITKMLNAAQKRLDKEAADKAAAEKKAKEQEKAIITCREKVIDAMFAYLIALGYKPKNAAENKRMISSLEAGIKSSENSLKRIFNHDLYSYSYDLTEDEENELLKNIFDLFL